MKEVEKQALIEHAKSWIADAEAARDDIPFGFDEDTEMELSLIKIALAALTAQPVAWCPKTQIELLAKHRMVEADLSSIQRFDEVPLFTRPARYQPGGAGAAGKPTG